MKDKKAFDFRDFQPELLFNVINETKAIKKQLKYGFFTFIFLNRNEEKKTVKDLLVQGILNKSIFKVIKEFEIILNILYYSHEILKSSYQL